MTMFHLPMFEMSALNTPPPTDESAEGHHEVTVSVDVAQFPLHNAMITGQTQLDDAARCYVRYKFYDKGQTFNKQYIFSFINHSRSCHS